MTEPEWLTSTDVRKLTKFLPQPLSRRKCVLAVCGYGRRIEHHIPHPAVIDYLAECERGMDEHSPPLLDGSYENFRARLDALQPPFAVNSSERSISHSLLWCLSTAGGERTYIGPTTYQGLRTAITHMIRPDPGNLSGNLNTHSEGWLEVYNSETIAQADIVRDIFGNPFRPVTLDPAWLTSDVLALARGIYDDRAFERMPILADALQDAGCDNDDVLTHCRDAKQVHVRGCWVVDLLLGKT